MTEQLPGFLRIALEVRLQIYTIALDQRLGYHPETYLAISIVSKQIRGEVLGIFFQNSSKFFQNLEHFAKWTARGAPHLLPLVSNVSLHIFKDSLLPIKETPRKCLPDLSSDSKAVSLTMPEFWEAEYARRAPPVVGDAQPSLSWMESFLNCLSISKEKIEINDPRAIATAWKSFAAISEVRNIWLLFQDTSDTGPPRRFDIEQQFLLDMMAAAFKNLQDLSVFSNLLSLEYMRNFHNLRSLRFTGYSTSTPGELSEILRSLKHLDTVIIYRYPDHYDKDQSIITSELPKYLSLTSEVIESLNPLRTFQVQHMTSLVPSWHLTVPMIKALRAHINSLSSLNISSDAPLDFDVFDSIIQFTASSRLRNVNLRLKSKQLIESLNVSSILPSHIKHGEASLEQTCNPMFAQDQWSYFNISSSGRCLSHVKGETICICTQQMIGNDSPVPKSSTDPS
ncbi:hypothetical protein BKA65DRAFT_33905 [Rhexocercosporidium sp. MPI-PUGE-AT-0058]|nr:hypothetical protein BKA65DRAFT_33905 [Rhexocercosporidium sp. MPI-PUGE-AT-0058]